MGKTDWIEHLRVPLIVGLVSMIVYIILPIFGSISTEETITVRILQGGTSFVILAFGFVVGLIIDKIWKE